jgi:hypothetical protein
VGGELMWPPPRPRLRERMLTHAVWAYGDLHDPGSDVHVYVTARKTVRTRLAS